MQGCSCFVFNLLIVSKNVVYHLRFIYGGGRFSFIMLQIHVMVKLRLFNLGLLIFALNSYFRYLLICGV